MKEYHIVDLKFDGTGYIVVENDDGTSFGQMVYGCPVNDEQACLDFLDGLAAEKSRDVIANRTPPVAMPGLQEMIGRKVTRTRR